MTELCGRSACRHVMLSTDELKLNYGNVVKQEHKVALNQLTKILQRPDQCRHHGAYLQTKCSTQQERKFIKRPEVLSDLAGQSTEHLQSHNINAVECSAMQLLQQFNHEVGKQNPSIPSKKTRGMPQRREVDTDLCFSRMQHSSAGRRAGHPPDSDRDSALLQAPRHSNTHMHRLLEGQPCKCCD